ncbi:MAG: carboxymuconolactone decarboxylase family protein [Chlorogloeopsis fritschii C42_A2020_084]|uniref:carboxymuconolactone decarboxylase family protein n=1 Tax=Chlorogloeopsis fritschii TaxID=1124 RepID=UPI0019D80EC1|nr:carboxymuconolactone decarboxylase family protein [Chlorogloeopsis fritschii]MBF2006024.1 carboxymuconolactone decarboxylase family protein [Chlorogloeopsis fritschii C42_A2020_084]
MEFTIHTIETAPEDSKEALVHAQKTFGFIPNLEGIFAEAPALLKGSMTLWDLFATTSFSPIEQQVIYLTANYEHECHYCIAAHSGLAKMIGMSVNDVQALRKGTPLENPKLQALRHFTQRMIQARGWIEDSEIEEFIAAGYNKRQVLEVILGITIKIMHNYTNHIAQTPLDKEFQPYKWQNQ